MNETPDTRPRCATCGEPQSGWPHIGYVEGYHPFQPAPTPSGDARTVAEIRAEIMDATLDPEEVGIPTQFTADIYNRWLDELEVAIRAESAAALQEARERAEQAEEDWDRESAHHAAVARDAVARAEAAEQRLREVEGERDRLRAAALEVLRHIHEEPVSLEHINACLWQGGPVPAATPSTDEEGR